MLRQHLAEEILEDFESFKVEKIITEEAQNRIRTWRFRPGDQVSKPSKQPSEYPSSYQEGGQKDWAHLSDSADDDDEGDDSFVVEAEGASKGRSKLTVAALDKSLDTLDTTLNADDNAIILEWQKHVPPESQVSSRSAVGDN